MSIDEKLKAVVAEMKKAKAEMKKVGVCAPCGERLVECLCKAYYQMGLDELRDE